MPKIRRSCCTGCGKDTGSATGLCTECRQVNSHRHRDHAGSDVGPWDHLCYEKSCDLSADALGPHGSDERWGLEYCEAEETVENLRGVFF